MTETIQTMTGSDPQAVLAHPSVEELVRRVDELSAQVATLRAQMPEDRITLGLLSGDFDRTMAAFIIALGCRAYDIEVDVFATFWGSAAFRDKSKRVDKSALDRMFGVMLPRGSTQLPLSKLQMMGIGPKMIRKLMASRGATSLEDLLRQAGEMGVRVHICTMTMGLMGLKTEEMLDYPGLDFVGVSQFVDMMNRSRNCWFF
jgi:peroxiredoxin family protein